MKIKLNWEKLVVFLAILLAVLSTAYFYWRGTLIAYGDAESHLTIAKRVIQGLTPGAAQLGGVWLPLPHLLLIPFVFFDFLWRTGLAGSLVSGLAFVICSLTLFKLSFLVTGNRPMAFLSALVFMVNPNILYLQSTPMTELTLLAFFLLNIYFFLKFIRGASEIDSLVLAAFFGFCATLSRYDGWFLVGMEIPAITWVCLRKKETLAKIEGKLILFSTLALYGVFLWFFWNLLIFGNPFYFNSSQFSAKAQQLAWHSRGELPAYRNLPLSFLYYLFTSASNVGLVVSVAATAGLLFFLFNPKERQRGLTALILLAPFIFYVSSLFLGQSVIFIPSLTPETFEWRLFNVRYGVMMVPTAAFFLAYLFSLFSKKAKVFALISAILLLGFQLSFYSSGREEVVTLTDGTSGLSSAKKVDAQNWLRENYDQGLVLLDDYARTLSVIRTNIPMKNIIYVGTKPYWEESFKEPEKYATWIIMQRGDEVWRHLYDPPVMQARLYKYFNKVYTSEEILIFKRMAT